MKILFDNALASATLSSLYASPNYPAANLQHRFLKKRFQAIVGSDTIRMEWATAKTVNSVFVGYTNATAFVLRLYDAGAALLATHSFTSSDLASHFASVSGVRAAELDVSNALSSVYVGGIGIGEAYTMPDPRNDWNDGLLDNSLVSSSADGQVSANMIESLRSMPFNFFTVGREDFIAIRALVAPVNKGVPLWVDPFHLDHSKLLPIYSTIEIGNIAKKDKLFEFTLNVTEAR
jgi:hypothetical protein